MLRIIAGEFKGRRLKTPGGRTVRPTGDRVKEAWFSILQQSIPEARVLDLFAGSGALGFEALSRGAMAVDFVENHMASLAAIRDNAATLKVEDRVTIHRMDAVRFAERLQPAQYDLAFADPPYASEDAAQLVSLFRATPFARAFSVEHAADVSLSGDDTRRYEFQMALMNRNLAPHIETVFLVPAFDLTYLSSSLVREVARFGGDVSQLVDPTVQQALKRKFSK